MNDDTKGSFPGDEKNVRDRLLELIGSDSVASFSRLSGVPESSLRAYLTRGIKPGMDHLVAIADVKGVTIDWLATGKSPRLRAELLEAMQGIDKQRLQVAVSAVEEGLRVSNKLLTAEKHAELICAAYELATTHDRALIVRIITAASR
jgi:transcriptional regulator with XRE-family HTH domain